MPATKNQFMRHEIIHKLLGICQLKMTKTDLLERVNQRLEEKDYPTISWRTLNNDISYLEREGAIIHRPSRSNPYYYYEEMISPEENIIDVEDMNTLKMGVGILKRISGFTIARSIEDILERLPYTRFTDSPKGYDCISFEDHTLASGTEWLDDLAESILSSKVLIVDYHSFKQSPEKFLFHPYYLKEYRNRWYVLGRHQIRNVLYTLALDRVRAIKLSMDDVYLENDLFDPETYFKPLIGVTWPEGEKPQLIRLQVYGDSVPYVETKKIHHSQRVTRRHQDGSIEIEMNVVINYELLSTILGLGAAVKVLRPDEFINSVQTEFKAGISNYS